MDDNRIEIVASLDIPKTVSTIEKDLEEVKRRLDADKALSIACSLDANSLTTLQKQISEISKKIKIDVPKIEIQAGTGQSAQNIENVAKSVETVTNKVLTLKKSLADIDNKFVESFRAVENSDGIINAERTMAVIQSRLSSLGTVTVTGKYNDQESADSINKIIARIEAASGEVRELNFLLDSTGQKFEYIGGSYSDRGVGKIQQDLARLSKELANFEASHKSIESGLIEPLTTARNAIIDLEAGIGSVESAQKALDNLKTVAANIGTSLKSTGSSFNIFDNAINKAKNFDNVLNALKKDIDVLSDDTVRASLGNDLANATKNLAELQQIEAQSGRGLTWSKKYGEVSQAIQEITNNLTAAQKEEKALSRETSLSNKIKTLAANMESYANANRKAINSNKEMSSGVTFAQRWAELTQQMAKGSELSADEMKHLNEQFRLFKAEAKAAEVTGNGFFASLTKGFKVIGTYITAQRIISSITGEIRSAVTELKNMDDILTEISKTSDRTEESLRTLGETSFDVASTYGRTASDYLLGVQEMSRAGFGEKQSEDLAELSLRAQAAGDMTAEMANQYIIATNAAYGLEGNIESLNAVLDSQNYITNRNALNMENLSEATKIAASQASASGVAIDELTAAVGTMVATTQQGGNIAGRAFKGILMNIQQVKADAADIGDGGESITTESLSKYEAATKALGVSLKEVKNGVWALRDPMQVLKELSEAVRKESEDSVKVANLISSVGGKYRGNQLIALLQNWDTYEKMLSEFNSQEAVGSAMQEAEKSANNWAGSINKLKNSWAELINQFINSDNAITIIQTLNNIIQDLTDSAATGTIKVLAGLLTDIVKTLGVITDKVGALPALISAIYTTRYIKSGKGKLTEYAYLRTVAICA